ncbi:MAG: ATP-binding cassette domain-containing protein, partial [Hyphomicrobiales bacterium]|nr:ATP-binding cassette domain-containing protein [Hyphomicrobiales bacterium]
MVAGSDHGEAVLSVRDLNVRFRVPGGEVHAVRGLNMQVAAGETVAIVGESGSGKSQAMMAAMGLLAANGWVEGEVRYRGQDLLGLPPRRLNRIRGEKITMIFQEPMTSLDPLYKVGRQLAEPLIHHRGMSRRQARARAIELLDLVQIAEPERRIDAYPHELSGGQRQRVMIAMALANDPDMLIADEPTTALDVTIQAQILELLNGLKDRLGMAIVFITHDLGIVRHMADRVYVMRDGEVVEEGPVARLFAEPRHDYTKMLLAAEPAGHKPPVPEAVPVLLRGDDLVVTFHTPGGFLSGEA